MTDMGACVQVYLQPRGCFRGKSRNAIQNNVVKFGISREMERRSCEQVVLTRLTIQCFGEDVTMNYIA
jgi:hypothetical protein